MERPYIKKNREVREAINKLNCRGTKSMKSKLWRD
jgi:hypothetical protein